MNKNKSIYFAAMMGLLLVACGSDSTLKQENDNTSISETSYDKNDLESILSALPAEGEKSVQAVSDNSTSVLGKLGETYDTYDVNKTSVTDFYNNSLEESRSLYTTFETISMDYFKCVAAQGLDDYDTWDDAMEDFYDTWDDAMEDFYDAWDDAMEDFYDTWDDAMEDFYDAWDEAYEDIYDKCDDLIESASDKLDYDDYSDVWS